jgi:hypothetical protein
MELGRNRFFHDARHNQRIVPRSVLPYRLVKETRVILHYVFGIER